MRLKIYRFHRVLALVLTIVALMVGQSAWAMSSFTVENPTGSTFRITRTGNTAISETIDWRVVSLSAIAGIHFTGYNGDYSGTVTFNVNDTYKDVPITENTPGDNAYKYQSGTSRKYRFEVLDKNGDILGSCDRSRSYGTNVSTGLFNEKEITIYTDELQYSDAGYDKNTNNPQYINSSSYYNLSGIAPVAYYTLIGAQLRSTLSFDAKEKNNGYQYVQILINNTSTCDNRKDCSDGDPGNISLSRYMAGFDHEPGSKNTTYAAYTFPVTSQPNNNSNPVDNAWDNGVTNKLYKQKFNTGCRATDGRLILPLDFTSLVVRFNASGGGTDNDEWYAKNVKAHIQAVDVTAPTVLNNYKVSGGRHQKGSIIYVSVPFSEIVTVTGTPTLTTSWGVFNYHAGSGSNVLTFKGEISSSASGTLRITDTSGTIQDIAGNSFSNPWSSNNKDLGTTLDSDYVWSISDFNQLGEDTYEVASKLDLRHLALLVNVTKNYCSGLTFLQTQDITCDDTYTPIGNIYYPFRGTYDGQDHRISGITVTRTGRDSSNDQYIGLFGHVKRGTVQNVALSGSSFTGFNYVGGIVGYNNGGTVKNCLVESSVTIHAGHDDACYLGGIIGQNIYVTVSGSGNIVKSNIIGCVSAATVSGNGKNNTYKIGGIVGYNDKSLVQDCLYTGTTVNGNLYVGAIAGLSNEATLTNNYYTSVSIGGVNGSDRDGARRAYIVTLGENVALVGSETNYDVSGLTAIGTGNCALKSGSTIYSGEGQTLTFSCTPATGETCDGFSTTAGTISGNTLTMPASDVTVSAIITDHWGIAGGADGSETHPYIITTTVGLDLLAKNVNGTDGYTANNFSGTFFELGADIAYDPTDLDDNDENYTAIGGRINGSNKSFRGTFDGDNKTISGIRIRKGSDDYQGLFGSVSGGTIKNVTLTDADITGKQYVGGIAGYISENAGTGGIIENCHVTSSVAIHAVAENAYYHGGIVGVNNGTVRGCTSAATLTMAEGLTNCTKYGGIVGYNSYNLQNNLVVGANISGNSEVGAVAGNKNNGNFTANYYRNCTVNGTANATGVGVGADVGSQTPHDIDGIRSVHSLTLPTNVTATGESVVISGTTYYASTTTVELNYNNLPAGFIITYSVNGETITGNTFEMPAADATVSATYTDHWGIADEADGSEEHPYIITTTTGLDLLAKMVNGTDGYTANNFDGKFFKLGADIIYPHKEADEEGADTEDNFTAIGGYRHSFQGVFDGDGHTISGIRIYKPGEDYQGLFGYVNGGTVKKVTLTDARITGKSGVAGIAGYTSDSSTKIDNCLILNAAITAQDYGGVLVGYKSDGTYSHNFYRNCIVKVGSNTYTTNVGLGAPQNDFAGEVVSIHTLTLPTGVTASGETVVIDGVTYYTNQTPITLTYSDPVPDGKTVVFIGTCSNGDVIQTFNTFEIPGADVTVSVVMSEAYSLTLPDNISATGMTTTIGGTEYFLSGTIVTLGYTPVDGGFTFNGYIVNGTAIDGNTFTMPAADVAVSATTIDVWGIADGADGSEAHPYIITTAAGLDLLATNVNSGINEYGGKYFKLGDNITYSTIGLGENESNYTAIGNKDHAFCGIFDGQGHTISGIRIYKPGKDYQGLFGRVYAGTVKNVTVTDARINGYNCVGGIAGQINGNSTIQDCLVLNSAINGVSSFGAITGKNISCHLSNNYYHNCSRTNILDGTTTTTNIGIGNGDVTTNDGAVYTNGIPLLNNRSNDYIFTTYNGMANQDYTLAGRTLYKDGDWNTLCLPFSVTDGDGTDNISFTGTPLEGATVMTLGNSSGCNTGFDASTGTLTLDFVPANEIEPGVAYIVKWNKADGYVDDDEHNLVNPVFTGVTIENEAPADHAVVSADQKVSFTGTYSPVTFDAADKSVLFMGGNNTLYYPDGTAATTINAFRAYFQLNFDGSSSIKEFKLNFGEEDADGIGEIHNSQFTIHNEADAIYNLAGQRITPHRGGDGEGLPRGIYIVNGKKVLF